MCPLLQVRHYGYRTPVYSITTTAADQAGSVMLPFAGAVLLTGLTLVGSAGVFASSMFPDGDESIHSVAWLTVSFRLPRATSTMTVVGVRAVLARRTTTVLPSSLI